METLHLAGHVMGALMAGIDPAQVVYSPGCRQLPTNDLIDDILICLMGTAAEEVVGGECDPARREHDYTRAKELLKVAGLPEGNLPCLVQRADWVASSAKENLSCLAKTLVGGGATPLDLSPHADALRAFHPQREVHADHEAGHAVLALHYGFEVSEVNLAFRLQSDGYAAYASDFDVNAIGPQPTYRALADALREMTVCYAGTAAVEHRQTLPHTHDPCSHDVLDAAEIALALELTWKCSQLYERLRTRAVERARKLVATRWAGIQAVASALIRDGRLTGLEVERLVRSADGNP